MHAGSMVMSSNSIDAGDRTWEISGVPVWRIQSPCLGSPQPLSIVCGEAAPDVQDKGRYSAFPGRLYPDLTSSAGGHEWDHSRHWGTHGVDPMGKSAEYEGSFQSTLR